ncbi:MAG: glycerol dehydrogenase [Geminicoccaceae bacterium]
MQTAQFPNRYVQGPGALGRFGAEAARLGDCVLLLVDRGLPDDILNRLDTSGLSLEQVPVDPACTPERIARAAALARDKGADAIAALGGGKVVDLGRATADDLALAFISVPTIAASDAPCSALAVVYDEDGKVLHDRFVRKNPDLVLVDSNVIAGAPSRFLAAGIGDALATFFEAEACRRSGAQNMVGGRPTQMANAVARLCRDTILEDGANAIAACDKGTPDSAFERVLEAAILLSGIGFESGGVAAAHAIHHGLAELPETQPALHGEKVAFGVLVEMVMQGFDEAEITRIARFNRSVRLPATLADLSVDRNGPGVNIVAKRACKPGEIIFNEPVEIDVAITRAAILRADEIARSSLISRGKE